jgi:hypothetical protein
MNFSSSSDLLPIVVSSGRAKEGWKEIFSLKNKSQYVVRMWTAFFLHFLISFCETQLEYFLYGATFSRGGSLVSLNVSSTDGLRWDEGEKVRHNAVGGVLEKIRLDLGLLS